MSRMFCVRCGQLQLAGTAAATYPVYLPPLSHASLSLTLLPLPPLLLLLGLAGAILSCWSCPQGCSMQGSCSPAPAATSHTRCCTGTGCRAGRECSACNTVVTCAFVLCIAVICSCLEEDSEHNWQVLVVIDLAWFWGMKCHRLAVVGSCCDQAVQTASCLFIASVLPLSCFCTI
jgi:hypothetical protein